MCLAEVPGVINLARTFNLPSLLPSAFYLSVLLPTIMLLEGSVDQDGNRIMPSTCDISKCLDGFIQLTCQEIIAVPLMLHAAAESCRVPTCRVTQIFHPLNGGWADMADSLGVCLYADSWLDEYFDGVCPMCQMALKKGWNDFRLRTWITLPDTFRLD